MDAWRKILFWGIGGDQLRVLDRKTEALLLAAETFDAVGALLGSKTNVSTLEEAWKNLLTAQGHDCWPVRIRVLRATGSRPWIAPKTSMTSAGAPSATTIWIRQGIQASLF